MTFRVAINAQILPGQGFGGVESVLIGLVNALGQLTDGDEEYLLIGPKEDPDWLKPYLGPNQRAVPGPRPVTPPNASLKQKLGPLGRLGRAVKRRLSGARVWPELPVSDGFYEGLGCQVIHFPYQSYTLCALPSVFNPHDLLHLHYPQFFNAAWIARREVVYQGGCRYAHTVAAASEWIKQDLIQHYGLHPDKIQVIPWAPPTQAYPEPAPEFLAEVRARYSLPEAYAFFPAMTWEHKNHIRLLEALALLRDRDGLRVNLVCSGHQYPGFWPRVETRLNELKLEGQVKFVGLVPPADLRALYRLAQFAALPTLFEAASGPLFEAWKEGTPVTCSAITSLPEQAGDAALLFDPLSVEEIAAALRRMAGDTALRTRLAQNGARRLRDFSWERTAKAYRAVYRRAAHLPLNEEDRSLLAWDWMRTPELTKRTE